MNVFNVGPGVLDLPLRRTDSRHLPGLGDTLTPAAEGGASFADFLKQGLDNVNSLENEATGLTTQMITDPDSVNAHDVTIALSKANMAIGITKQVVDKAIQAYKTLTTLR